MLLRTLCVNHALVLVSTANTNGHQDEQVAEPGKETEERSTLENVTPEHDKTISVDHSEATANEQTSAENNEPADAKEPHVEDSGQENAEELSKETQQQSKDSTEQDASSGDKQPNSVDTALHNVEVPYNKVLIMILNFC